MRAGENGNVARTCRVVIGVGKKPAFGRRAWRAELHHQLGVRKRCGRVRNARIDCERRLEIAEGRTFDDHQCGAGNIALRQPSQ
jgi:hypothetical protein